MATTNTFVAPSDGWVAVAVAPKFVRISGFPQNHSFYVYAGSAPPALSVVGVAVEDGCPFWCNVTATDTFYVRNPNPLNDGSTTNGAIRIDTLQVN